MVKEETVYTTSDGKQYKTKKSAERHENMLTMENKGYTKKEVDELLKEIAVKNKRIEIMLERYPDWRDMGDYLVKQLPKLIEDHKNGVVTYKLVSISGWLIREEKDILTVRLPRLGEEEYPEEFIKRVNDLTEDNKDKTGSTFELEIHEETDNLIKYKIRENKLSPEEKIAKGLRLMESDIESMLWDREEVYEEKGENRRWSQSVTTVVKGNDGYQYAIHWEHGLTENQENEFYEQPQRVELREREVTTIVTDIVYLDKQE